MATTHAHTSRAHVTFKGGTAAEQQAAQDALDKRFHDDDERKWDEHGPMVGYVEVVLERSALGWRIRIALMHPSNVGAGAIGSPIPPPGEPRDCTEEVADALLAAGIHAFDET